MKGGGRQRAETLSKNYTRKLIIKHDREKQNNVLKVCKKTRNKNIFK